MRIEASDGKSYEVKPDTADTFGVYVGADHVADFTVGPDDVSTKLLPAAKGKTTEKVVREVAQDFIDNGGLPMRMM